MTISLGELVSAAKQQDDQIGVSDRWQKGVNDLSEGVGTILGSIYGGRLVGGLQNAGNGDMSGKNVPLSSILQQYRG